MYILVRKINTVAINGEIVIDGISWWDAIFFVDAFYKQLHCKDNLSSILHWIWIEPELEVNWTWIGASTSLHRKRNEIKAWFSDEFFITKKFLAFFLSHRHTCCESVSYAWQESFSPVTLPSQGYVCVIGAWHEKYASVTPNWLILRLCDGVIGKTRKKYFFSHGDFFLELNVKHIHAQENIL